VKIVNIAEAKARLSDYVKLVERGEVIVLARRNQPVAEIRPLPRRPGRPRPFGLCKGEFQVPKDFDDPLPESVLQDFEGR
jgi:prevent-host-death family protein